MKWFYTFAAAFWFAVGLLWVQRDAPEMWVMCFAVASGYVALLVRAWRDA